MPYERERIAPTGSTVAVVVLGDPIRQTPDDGAGPVVTSATGLLIGPHDRPVVNEPTGETFAVGIVTTPVGCRSVFGAAPAELRSRVVELTDVWAPASRLRSALAAIDDPDTMLRCVETVLGDELAAAPPGLERCEAALTLIATDPTAPIGDIATEVGVSREHLAREFTRIVGLTPRVLARLLRMRRLLAAIDVHGAVGWQALAADLGWFDQAHLIRDFRRHTGVTPTAYLAAQRAGLTAVETADAAGFVPEL